MIQENFTSVVHMIQKRKWKLPKANTTDNTSSQSIFPSCDTVARLKPLTRSTEMQNDGQVFTVWSKKAKKLLV